MIRFAASLSGGLLLMTTSFVAQAAATVRAEVHAVVSKDVVQTAAATGELTGLLSGDFIAPAERVMLAAEPAQKQTSGKKC